MFIIVWPLKSLPCPSQFYVKDTFGLQTLDARGDLSVCVQSGVKHVEWHSNFTVFTSCMVEWLV